ncbi:hypothetical protein Y032_0618g708 [Ancylostoma ceylanicum]|uniref:Helix-turn-helix domain-containing protein n=1 Tax=Ancylostoma ceylanicum TaxID=53326 RepID=A0A016WKI5_9BILA|nr:hypothetical protein Y032_0618g708 [Ancylostoma ceylanicum]
MLNNLNSCDPNIHFTVESPDDSGFLPYLNTKVRICDGTKEFLWYKKPFFKNIILHSRSAHPLYMKANVVQNLIITKEKTCNQVSPEMEENIRQILEDNGYTTSKPSSWRPYSVTGGIPLVLPCKRAHREGRQSSREGIKRQT